MDKELKRELLELAAKAAGIPVRWNDNPPCTVMIDDIGDAGWWSPLTDDGDALRLAVKLRISVIRTETYPNTTECAYLDNSALEPRWRYEAVTGSDANEITRLAITRAAAEIGRQMK